MAVEALKIIREGEEEGRKLLDEAKASVATILKDAEDEVKRLKERAREDEKRLASEISAQFVQAGKQEAESILKTAGAEVEQLKTAGAEVEQLKTATKSNLERTVDVVLEKILGVR